MVKILEEFLEDIGVEIEDNPFENEEPIEVNEYEVE